MKRIMFMITALTIFFFLPTVMGTQVNTTANITGEGYLAVEFENDEIVSKQYFEVNGTMFVRITFDDGHSQVKSLEEYIHANEDKWSQDRVGSSGIDWDDVVRHVRNAIDWFLGTDSHASDDEKEFVYQLSRGFVTRYEHKKLQQQNLMFSARIKALENTMEEIAGEKYCEGKVATMLEYNFTSVKCGETSYHNHMKDPVTGQDMVISLTPIDETTKSDEVEEVKEDYSGNSKIPERVVMDIGSLIVPEIVEVNEEFELEVMVKNLGINGSDEITLTLPDGWTAEVNSQVITLSSGEDAILYFKITPNEEEGRIAVTSSADFEVSDMITPETEKPEGKIELLGFVSKIDFSTIVDRVVEFMSSIDWLPVSASGITISSFVLLIRKNFPRKYVYSYEKGWIKVKS